MPKDGESNRKKNPQNRTSHEKKNCVDNCKTEGEADPNHRPHPFKPSFLYQLRLQNRRK